VGFENIISIIEVEMDSLKVYTKETIQDRENGLLK
jgi:hypothetical protein